MDSGNRLMEGKIHTLNQALMGDDQKKKKNVTEAKATNYTKVKTQGHFGSTASSFFFFFL